jgi:hypothetical protein
MTTEEIKIIVSACEKIALLAFFAFVVYAVFVAPLREK